VGSFNGFPVFMQGNWNVSTFFAAYVTLPIFGLSFLGWKLVKKTKLIPLAEIDFQSGRKELDEMQARDAEVYKEDSLLKQISGILF
jgi:amino acid transporter